MKHIFVVNPNAGKNNRTQEITDKLKTYDGKIDYEIYVTKGRGDGIRFVRDYLEKHPKEETYRLYACGGDGTLYDVVNGAYGFPNAEVTCYAIGSGNDFIKNFRENRDKYKDLDKLIAAKPHKIDIITVGDRCCINITNYGFDGEVTFAQLKFKRWPFVSGPMAYNLAAVTCLLFKMKHYLKITVDDKVVFDGTGILAVAANGFCYGGGFYCAPKAVIDDGLIDVCIVKKISRFSAAGFMKTFKAGNHLTDKKLSKKIIYLTGKKVVFESDRKVAYSIDGEVFRDPKLVMEMHPGAMNFAEPV